MVLALLLSSCYIHVKDQDFKCHPVTSLFPAVVAPGNGRGAGDEKLLVKANLR